ncbi:MAG: response regulator transcription factor [Chloroflexi bacterium]|nr:response regulator transcription factor [Chloroflexota bacterium]
MSSYGEPDIVNIRVMVADDHAIIREALEAAISRSQGLELVGQASSGSEAIGMCRSLQPDVIVMDLRLGDMSGISAVAQIRADSPQTKVLVFTSSKGEADVTGAIEAGARGYLLKGSSSSEVIAAIRTIQIGGSTIEPSVASILFDRMAGGRVSEDKATTVTSREKEILTLIAGGMTNQEVGGRLNIAEATVKTHLTHAYSKLNVSDRTEAVVRALQLGLIEIED